MNDNSRFNKLILSLIALMLVLPHSALAKVYLDINGSSVGNGFPYSSSAVL